MRDLRKNGSTYVDWKPRNSSLIQPEPPPPIPDEKKKEIMDRDKVWVSEPEQGFILGRIVDITDDGVSIQPINDNNDEFNYNSKAISASFDRLYPSEDDEASDVDDNCGLMYLNEATLLHNVRVRYGLDKIYTYVANILIAINPYKEIKNLYSSKTVGEYRGKSLGTMPPHIFAIADKAFRDMKVLKKSQSVVVSGESGAGKTESTKYILKYLCDNFGSKGRGLEEKILNANPILEAFGNAKTTRNNNSSRFGKFIEIHFDTSCKVVGGYISHYLLERARVTSQSSEEERNYHIFYQLCAGAPSDLKNKLHLGSVEKFRYLKHGCTRYFGSSSIPSDRCSAEFKRLGPLKDPNLDDVKDFLNVDKDLSNLGMSELDRLDVYTAIASVLHIGNISFEDDPDDNRGGCRVTEDSENSLNITAELLKLDTDELRRALTARVMQATKGGGYKGTVIMVPLKVHEASNARDALAKAIYSRLFDYIVKRINNSIPFEKSAYYIGVLDIAGFEYFTVNSFEQFCINYCNEKLQQFFNQRILKEEQMLYEKEGLGVKKISFVDNQDCIDLIESKGNGVFSLLDEESKLPKPNHQHFTNAVHAQNTGHFRLSLPRKSKLRGHREIRDDDGFLIRHFAGAVCYQTASFIEKNNDALHASLEALAVEESQNPFIQSLFASARSTSGSMKGKLTFLSVGNKFKSQLEELMDKLRSTGTNFIRCIKPNGKMIPQLFQGGSILSQLQCAGMASVLELMQQGYPSRTSFSELYKLYSGYLPPELTRLDPRHFCKVLFKALGLNDEDFKFGLTKVFFRPGKFAEFDQMLRSDPENLKELIKKVKHWLIRSHWKKVQWCALSVIKLKNKIIYRRNALVILQKTLRGHLARKRHGPRYRGILRIKKCESQIQEISRLGTKLKNSHSSDIGLELTSAIAHIKANDRISEKEIDKTYKSLVAKIDQELRLVKESLQKQRMAQEEAIRLKKVQEEMERQRKIKEAEDNKKQAFEEEIRLKSGMEARRKVEEKSRIEQYEADRIAAERLQTELDKENARLREQIEQERRDHELALRLATESNSVVEEDSGYQAQGPLKRSTLVHRQREEHAHRKYDLSKWKYAELRDTINTSCDIELLEACREEFHRRLKVYHAWKAKNRKKNDGDSTTFDDHMRVPKSILEEASRINSIASTASSNSANVSNNKQRFFRIPFVRPDTGNKGWWYAHFDGDWIGRQMEIHPEKGPVLLVSGKDDMQMCELSLDETGLTRKRGAEILEQEFEKEWLRNGGSPYIRPSDREQQRHPHANHKVAAR
ncbi:unconventional myosin-VI isoform X2 [Lepeophtheirus salmonis]|uniref:Myosin motor domain-containing protein n=1 Tax=Lepeophtheirus salmonis TaxID=72036 RepID=A0A0K2TFG3_LEPSM|nr:myosin heavy chain 95F-like isoform X2 [Lepeophtheirus salmonis]